MLALVEHIDTSILPLDSLVDLAREELFDDSSRKLHVVIHNAEIPAVLKTSKQKIRVLWFEFWSDRYSGASVIRSVGNHTDSDLPKDEAFILIVTHVEGGG